MRQKLKITEGNCKGQTELTDKEKRVIPYQRKWPRKKILKSIAHRHKEKQNKRTRKKNMQRTKQPCKY